MPTQRSSPVRGIVGLGLMGQALAHRLLASGLPVLGFDPDASKRERFSAMGGQPCPDLRTLLGEATHLVICVFDAGQARTVADSLPDASGRPGGRQSRVVACTTTCEPRQMAELGNEVERRGHHFVEMPISGTSQQFAKGSALGLVACRASVHEAQQDFLREICAERRYLGETFGNASATKLAVNLVLGINRAALAEGLAFGKALGLEPRDFLSILRDSAAYSQVMDVKGAAMAERRFESPQSRVDQSHKDFSLILHLGREAGIGLPFAQRYLQMMADSMAHGEGHLDNAIIIAAVERYSG